MKKNLKTLVIIALIVIAFNYILFITSEKPEMFFIIGSAVAEFLLVSIIYFIFKNPVSEIENHYSSNINISDIPDDFKVYYNELYKENGKRYKRIAYKKFFKVILELFLGISLVALYILINILFDDMDFSASLIFKIILLIIIGSISFWLITLIDKELKNGTKIYKSEFVSKILKKFNSDYIYKYENLDYSYIISQYRDAGFNEPSFCESNVTDYLENVDANGVLRIADIYLVTVRENNSRYYIFNGLFAVYSRNQVLNTNIPKILIGLASEYTFYGDDENRLNLENSSFSELFAVYSIDKLTATRLLTSDIQEQLVNFYNTYHILFEVIILDNSIYLRFYTGEMFEKKLTVKEMFKYHLILNFIRDLSQDINNAINDIDI